MYTPRTEQAVASRCLHELELLAEWFDDEISARDLLDFITDNGFRITPITHRTQVVQVGAWSARIDIGLVPIIEALWKRGIPTHASCEGGSAERAYVSFPERQGGLASYAKLIHAGCRSAVPSLRVDKPHGDSKSVLRWSADDTNRLCDAVAGMAWPSGLALRTDRPTVTDLYEWQ